VPQDVADWTQSVIANTTPSVQATQLSVAGSSVVLLPDTSIFSVGDTVKISSGLVTLPPGATTTAQIQAINPDVSVTITPVLLADCKVGDVVSASRSPM
jgi:hypothetical protein